MGKLDSVITQLIKQEDIDCDENCIAYTLLGHPIDLLNLVKNVVFELKVHSHQAQHE